MSLSFSQAWNLALGIKKVFKQSVNEGRLGVCVAQDGSGPGYHVVLSHGGGAQFGPQARDVLLGVLQDVVQGHSHNGAVLVRRRKR